MANLCSQEGTLGDSLMIGGNRSQASRYEIERQVPDLVDLTVMAVESGIGIAAAAAQRRHCGGAGGNAPCGGGWGKPVNGGL